MSEIKDDVKLDTITEKSFELNKIERMALITSCPVYTV